MAILGNKAEGTATEDLERLMGLFFSQGCIGMIIMALASPTDWKGAKDREKTLDDIYHNEKVIKFNRRYLDYFSLKEKDLINKSPSDFYSYDLSGGRKTWESLLDNGRYHINSFEQSPGFWLEGKSSGFMTNRAFNRTRNRHMGTYIQKGIKRRPGPHFQ
jgi:hypothetical protein